MEKGTRQYAEIDCEVCVQCGACTGACPEYVILDCWVGPCFCIDPDSCNRIDCNVECIKICPAHCIELKDLDGYSSK
jgi:ferredoxin-like protein FixX